MNIDLWLSDVFMYVGFLCSFWKHSMGLTFLKTHYCLVSARLVNLMVLGLRVTGHFLLRTVTFDFSDTHNVCVMDWLPSIAATAAVEDLLGRQSWVQST